jgi:hypothetical protein
MTLQKAPATEPTKGDETTDYRDQLQASRWGKSLKGGRLPAMSNSEMNPTSTRKAVAFWLVLGLVTFAIVVAGYSAQIWAFTS